MRLQNFLLVCLACLGGLQSSAWAQAQSYPTKAIRWIVPYSIAGASDNAARLMAVRFAALLGQEIVVENKAGAGGMVGTDLVAKAAPDGYTMVWGGSNALAGSVTLQKNMPYSALKDFAPVCRVGVISYVLVANPALGVKSVSELIALVKASPQTLAYASPGNGGASHLSMELFQNRTNTNFLNVQYKGSSPGVNDLLAGHVPLMFESVGAVGQHVLSGKLVALTSSSAKRLQGLPEVPTMQELGYQDFLVQGWAGILFPAGTPPPVVKRMTEACRTVLAQPDVQDVMLRQQGWEVDYLDPEGFGAFINAEVSNWARMLAISKVNIE